MFLDVNKNEGRFVLYFHKNNQIVKTLKILVLILPGLLFIFSCGSNKTGKTGKVNDIDGNVYSTVVVGSQTWMAENLKTTKYNDGTQIPEVTDDSIWSKLNTAAMCWYKNDAQAGKATYGAEYNWYTVSTGKLCPAGWHVPSDKEWRQLTNYLGGDNVAGNEMKAISGWNKGGNGSNTSGFTGIPAGYRSYKGPFNSLGLSGYWWSSSLSSDNAWYTVLFSKDATAFKYYGYKGSGYAVRCVMDGKK